MPRLLLVDDDGREMFSAQVSAANVERTATFLRRHMGTLQMIADAKHAVSKVLGVVDQVRALGPATPPRPRRRRVVRR